MAKIKENFNFYFHNRQVEPNPNVLIEFSLNVFIAFAEFSTKIFVITLKGLELATFCVRDQDATTVPTRPCQRLDL